MATLTTAISNADIANALEEVADLLEVEEEANSFRIQAYRRAADTVRSRS